jgi:type II restriction/modification system DNA methylase subunit YeeA
MKTLLLFIILTSVASAQNAKPCGTEAECNTAFQKRVAEQKALDDKAKADEKTKADAIAKMDNKNPQPIKKEEDRLRIEKLQARALLDQQKLETMQVAIKAALTQPIASAQASVKAYNEAVAEAQKQYHAEGCQPLYDEKGDVKISKNGKEVWDCTKAGK